MIGTQKAQEGCGTSAWIVETVSVVFTDYANRL
jgi:hypothetical protein